MACNLPVQKNVKKAADCKCYAAVMRTYNGMRNEPEHVALEAAQRVYRYHHPEDTIRDAHLTVESWINENRVQ